MTDRSRLLLDTHVFLWWKLDAPQLKPVARDAISRADVVFVSAASAWEAAIKARLGKLELTVDFAEGVNASGFERLPISFEHAAETRNLPDHHHDPFDRMLIAQARVERLVVVTHDALFVPYGLDLIRT
ncbi:type II toxin-antitoxin system VapC family toxin [uncultured Thiodictyon sp.]|uniref:type II toxin-antitoxin system VapC family toxin n=1 Tax=uncultured Thiodictyon sp. TaxID=1846217 RepID=UPI0025E32680|nr:type II toxin-antitoxin system VapC family toxin [uncultured Thiodictyon sp.]